MELRYLKTIVQYGDMFKGENNLYETVLQYKKDGIWYNVKTIEQ